MPSLYQRQLLYITASCFPLSTLFLGFFHELFNASFLTSRRLKSLFELTFFAQRCFKLYTISLLFVNIKFKKLYGLINFGLAVILVTPCK